MTQKISGTELKSHHTQHPWWLAAIIASLTGLCVSLIISAVVSVGIFLKLQPLVALERTGIEEGMRLYAAFSQFLPEPQAQGPSFVYIDVDIAGCEKYLSVKTLQCHTSNPVTAPITAAAIQWARLNGAVGIIIDRVPFENSADRTLVANAATQTGPWVIAPMAGRSELSGGEFIFNRDRSSDLIDSNAMGGLRLAAYDAVVGDQTQDGKLRSYRFDEATRLEPGGTPGWRAPTVGYLAANLWLASERGKTDCRYYGLNCAAALPVESFIVGAVPIGFSIPSLSVLERLADGQMNESAGDPAVVAAQDRYESVSHEIEPVVRRLKFSELVSGNNLAKGRIVIIGSSEPTALDQVFTPVGPMSGSEFLMNAIRSISIGISTPTSEKETLWTTFLEKAVAAIRGAGIMTLAWLAIFALWRSVKHRPVFFRIGSYVAVTVIFLSGMLVVGFVETFQLAHDAGRGLFRGHFVDVVTPLIALGLEGYADAISLITQNIERTFSKIVEAAESAIARIK